MRSPQFVVWRQRVENALESLLPKENDGPAVLHRAMRYAVLGGGKRIRPILVYASGAALGGHQPTPRTAAASYVLKQWQVKPVAFLEKLLRTRRKLRATLGAYLRDAERTQPFGARNVKDVGAGNGAVACGQRIERLETNRALAVFRTWR